MSDIQRKWIKEAITVFMMSPKNKKYTLLESIKILLEDLDKKISDPYYKYFKIKDKATAARKFLRLVSLYKLINIKSTMYSKIHGIFTQKPIQMNLKKQIIKLITKSELTNKEVVAILDEVRTNYHNRKNVGDKVVSEREQSTVMQAMLANGLHPLSKDKSWVFFKGGWRKIRGGTTDRHIVYIKAIIPVKFKKK
jgi:hypothetical protein